MTTTPVHSAPEQHDPVSTFRTMRRTKVGRVTRTGSILPIAVMAFALVAFLFVLDYSMSGGKWPWSVNSASKNTNTEVVVKKSTIVSDHQTFTDPALGFSLQLPLDWEVDTSRSTTDEVVFLPNAGTESRESVKSTVTDQTLDNWLATFAPAKGATVTDTQVAGQPAKRVQTNAFALNYIAFRYGDRLFVVTSNTKIIDLHILDTFTAADETADWKLYTDSATGFGISYPSNWTVNKTSSGATFTGASLSSAQFSTPIVVVKKMTAPYPKDSCLISDTTVEVNGTNRRQQVKGCGYAGAEVATFFQTPTNDYFVVSWTQDVPDAYHTYKGFLQTFHLTLM